MIPRLVKTFVLVAVIASSGWSRRSTQPSPVPGTASAATTLAPPQRGKSQPQSRAVVIEPAEDALGARGKQE